VHVVPKHVLFYAPQRLRPNPFIGKHARFNGHPPWYDHEKAMLDLPRKPRGRQYQWLFVECADFGYYPDPFAMVVWAFNRELPGVYEMFSWKHTRVNTDDQGTYLRTLWDALPTAMALVGDPAGKQDDFDVWRERLSLPMEEADKAGKNTLEEFLADAIRREERSLREGSPLYLEMKHLVYLPQRPGKTREVDKHRRAADGIVLRRPLLRCRPLRLQVRRHVPVEGKKTSRRRARPRRCGRRRCVRGAHRSGRKRTQGAQVR
jgi:hypothetical protein